MNQPINFARNLSVLPMNGAGHVYNAFIGCCAPSTSHMTDKNAPSSCIFLGSSAVLSQSTVIPSDTAAVTVPTTTTSVIVQATSTPTAGRCYQSCHKHPDPPPPPPPEIWDQFTQSIFWTQLFSALLSARRNVDSRP